MHDTQEEQKTPQNTTGCSFCGETIPRENASPEISPQETGPSGLSDNSGLAEGPGVSRQSPWLLLLLVLLTGGIYEAFWYRKAARFLNELEGRKKFGSLSFVFLLVGYSFYFLLSMVKGSNESLGIEMEGLKMLSGTLWLTMTSFVILVSLRMAETLRAWYERESLPFRCNQFLTVLLNVFYIQHKINRLKSL